MDIMTGPAEQGQQVPHSMIGRYRLTRRLGAGSFATVWEGHDDDLDVPVAVKVLADNWSDNDDVRSRFLSEARIMRKIRDPRIVRVYDIGTLTDGRPYFVMDFADAGSLDDLRRSGVEPIRALRLCAEGCRALNVLHQHDIVHRDVTPGNLLLSHASAGELQVFIADLGVAKLMVGQSGATMTAGTPAYMALEQASGIGQFDQRADIYSLGAVTYAMLTGRPPFPVRTLADLLTRDPHAVPAPIAERIGAPPTLDALMVSVLSPEPGRRPPTADILADALDQIADQMAGTAQPYWQGMRIDQASVRPSPMTNPTPNSYLPQSNLTPNSMIGPGGYQVPEQPFVPGGPSSQSGTWPPPSDPTGPTTAPIEQDRPRSRLFYAFVGIAALALFFVSLLVTVVLLH